ncbi:MAG: hypothetical protein JWO87_2103, partial [Phycisphaerales bacterium]|nr:hypothetical protein [Phycisphaerales bacterium]
MTTVPLEQVEREEHPVIEPGHTYAS